MIPKKIHYCWFGRNKKNKIIEKCIKSWKKHLPDYEFIEWNEDNFDINICPYVKEAYDSKKWAFVSDYARYYVLYKHGGIYLDTDVEVLKSLNPILEKGSFMGRESIETGGMVAPGLILGAEKGMKLYKEILDIYNEMNFINQDGTFNLRTVVQITTEILENKGFEIQNNEIQSIDEIYIYPSEYFCPIGWNGLGKISENSYSIHHYAASWLPVKEQKMIQLNIAAQSSNPIKRIVAKVKRKILKIIGE